MRHSVDVVVVGGGPAGSVAALLFASEGLDVMLLEGRHFPRAKPCGEYMSPGTVDALTDLGLSDAVFSSGARLVEGMNIIAPSGPSMEVRYRQGGAPRSAITLCRADLDQALLGAARKAGVRVCEGHRALRPVVEQGQVRGVLARRNGELIQVDAALTVAADGNHSPIAKALQLQVAPRWPVRLGLVAHFSESRGCRRAHGEMHVSRRGYCGIAPLPDGRLNVAVVLRADEIRHAHVPAGEVFQRWLREHPRLARSLEGAEQLTSVYGTGPIGARCSRPWFPGALLVGDAAGFFDPFTGEGIFRAIRGAELAARVGSDAVRRGRLGEEGLAPYAKLRREQFRHKEAVTRLVQLFVQYPSLMRYALPRLSSRDRPYAALTSALGDIADARDFLQPRVLWSALHP